MKIIDLTPKYIKYVIKQNRKELYFNSYPLLFRHYYKYWASKKYFTARPDEIKKLAGKIKSAKSSIKYLQKKFADKGFNVQNINFILMIGQGTTNGHAFYDRNTYNIFLPLEAYHTKKQMDIFICHELTHALHYSANKNFYFRTVEAKNELARQLITEGIATYFSEYILDADEISALWADYIPKNQARNWMKECERNNQALKKYCLKNLHSAEINLFSANDPKDIWKDRAGYFIGLKFITSVAKKITLKQLLKINKNSFYSLLTTFLK